MLVGTLQSPAQPLTAECMNTPPHSLVAMGAVASLLVSGADSGDAGHSEGPIPDAPAPEGNEAVDVTGSEADAAGAVFTELINTASGVEELTFF